jgi:hypothetical protein
MKSEFLMTIDESDNIYFTFSDEKIIMAMNTAGDTLYHIHLNREPIAYNSAEKKHLLAEATKDYLAGYADGVKRESGKALKSISPSKLPKDTYRYKPYTLALMSPKKNQLWTLVPVQNEPTKIICDELLNGNLQRSFALNIPAANLIFNAFQEIVVIKNNYLFQIASDADGLQRVVRYKID